MNNSNNKLLEIVFSNTIDLLITRVSPTVSPSHPMISPFLEVDLYKQNEPHNMALEYNFFKTNHE